MDKATVKAHKISDQEYEEILKILGREPNLLELGIFSAMWSEHCSYKSSKKYLNPGSGRERGCHRRRRRRRGGV